MEAGLYICFQLELLLKHITSKQRSKGYWLYLNTFEMYPSIATPADLSTFEMYPSIASPADLNTFERYPSIASLAPLPLNPHK